MSYFYRNIMCEQANPATLYSRYASAAVIASVVFDMLDKNDDAKISKEELFSMIMEIEPVSSMSNSRKATEFAKRPKAIDRTGRIVEFLFEQKSQIPRDAEPKMTREEQDQSDLESQLDAAAGLKLDNPGVTRDDFIDLFTGHSNMMKDIHKLVQSERRIGKIAWDRDLAEMYDEIDIKLLEAKEVKKRSTGDLRGYTFGTPRQRVGSVDEGWTKSNAMTAPLASNSPSPTGGGGSEFVPEFVMRKGISKGPPAASAGVKDVAQPKVSTQYTAKSRIHDRRDKEIKEQEEQEEQEERLAVVAESMLDGASSSVHEQMGEMRHKLYKLEKYMHRIRAIQKESEQAKSWTPFEEFRILSQECVPCHQLWPLFLLLYLPPALYPIGGIHFRAVAFSTYWLCERTSELPLFRGLHISVQLSRIGLWRYPFSGVVMQAVFDIFLNQEESHLPQHTARGVQAIARTACFSQVSPRDPGH
ncbi:hypothetical protein CYMTET_56759 [Cymbomonas tetramitiformis]|uniref:EF-hand domain-containing protein n=1 Tax=Cymbomonas tetramitiformis TaxID=36881 RepID=A0AAE0BC25_9CHLO|nr:hypothetical protein CYMTET_56759 [Cymbomonas tetramitiformis]